MKTKIAIIDGDELAYSIAHRHQKTYYDLHNGDIPISLGYKNKTDAIEAIGNDTELDIIERLEDRLFNKTQLARDYQFKRELNDRVTSIMNHIGTCDSFIFCLNGKCNFRYALATLMPYKGNRTLAKPLHLKAIKTVIVNQFKTKIIEHLESDDTMVVIAASLKSTGLEPIICSSDKDLKTVEGWNYDISKRKLSYIDKAEALRNFYYQILIGDQVDNIPSPYGLGKVGAENIINDFKKLEIVEDYETSLYNYVLPHYEKHLLAKDSKGDYKTKWYDNRPVEDVIFEIGNLLYMHRTDDESETWKIPIK